MATRKKKPLKQDSAIAEQNSPPGPYSLRAIYIKKSSMEIPDEFDPLIPGQQLFASNKIHTGSTFIRETFFQHENGEETKFKSVQFVIAFSFGYTKTPIPDGTEPDREKDFAAYISAEIVADYILNQTEIPTPEELGNWGRKNAVIHCWPYWREFCSNAQLRMSLPVTLVPLFAY